MVATHGSKCRMIGRRRRKIADYSILGFVVLTIACFFAETRIRMHAAPRPLLSPKNVQRLQRLEDQIGTANQEIQGISDDVEVIRRAVVRQR